MPANSNKPMKRSGRTGIRRKSGKSKSRAAARRYRLWTLVLFIVAGFAVAVAHSANRTDGPAAALAASPGASVTDIHNEPNKTGKGNGQAVSVSAFSKPSATAAFIELPEYESDEFVIFNTTGRYTISYDTARLQARWVAYKLTRSDIGGGAERSSGFATDKVVMGKGWRAATDKDYKGSGYDRGHLVPSADRLASREENRATFLLSNVSPQLASFNRGIWKTLEEEVRKWCGSYDTLYVVVGSLPGKATIGESGICIPGSFFKALAARSGDDFETVAYLFPHTADCDKNIRNYRLTVDSLETVTSLNFFHALPDEVEEAVESYAGDLKLCK